MVRIWFYRITAMITVLLLGIGYFWPPVFWSLLIFVPLIVMGFHDALQKRHTVLRNFPLIGRVRYWFESVRPEIQQYFIESNIDAHPIEREMRSIVYQRAKGALETKPFGTERDVYQTGYEWVAHALTDVPAIDAAPRMIIGSSQCKQPYSSSLLNVSGMSYGALSPNAIKALNLGAKKGQFAHNTGEGGISPYHLQGGDLIWQLGTAYFGCRTRNGGFDPEKFREQSARDEVKMIELKLSQGAKPGHGGMLPACKVTEELAEIRGVPIGEDVLSPPRHQEFKTPIQMMEFIARLRELANGKPVGFKLCVGRRLEVLSICKAMRETGIVPDFITVDGGEGGTGAAPLEFSNSVGMPARDAWNIVHNALVGSGLRKEVRIIASGKLMTGFHMVRAMALGADLCNSARAMMFALGCIQALRCNTNKCPTGITTQNPKLYYGLDVDDKFERVYRFHHGSMESLRELMIAMGVRDVDEITPDRFFRRTGDLRAHSFAELYDFLKPDALLNDDDLPVHWRQDWQQASAKEFAPLA